MKGPENMQQGKRGEEGSLTDMDQDSEPWQKSKVSEIL